MTEVVGNSLTTPTTTLAGAIGAGDTALSVEAWASPLPQTGTFRIRIDDELIEVGAVAGTALETLTRGVEGTAAVAHSHGAAVDLALTAGGLSAFTSGVWKTYGIESSNANPFLGIDIGNGRLIARWWTPAPVVAAYATPPFLTFVTAALEFGSTTEVTGPITFQGPFGVDGEALEIDNFLTQADSGTPDDFFGLVPTHAMARLGGGSPQYFAGVGLSPSDACVLFSTNADQSNPALSWRATIPGTWAEGDLLAVNRTYLGAFYGD